MSIQLSTLHTRASLAALIALAGVGACHSFAQSTHFAKPGITVDIPSAVAMPGVGTQNLKIHLSYAFSERETVWLQGIGTVPATGSLDYVVHTQVLHFRTAKGGETLASVPFTPTKWEQGLEMGNPFPPSVMSGSGWHEDSPILLLLVSSPQSALRIPDVLSHQGNPKLLFTPCRPDDGGCVLSQWTTLTGPAETMQVQLGMMLVYAPAPANGSNTAVKVFYVGRQGLLGATSYSNTLDQASLTKCMAKVQAYRDLLATIHP